jgi:release factor glutamine methyltransferase
VQLKQSLAAAITQLTADRVPSPRLNAELLLMFTLDCDRALLYAHPERELTAAQSARYQAALAERARGVPAQYITGHQEFWGLDFIVTPAVLIPRPETEHLIETVLALVDVKKARVEKKSVGRALLPADSIHEATSIKPAFPNSLHLADVGTGSGCIAIALAKELPHAEIHATDISPSALEIARANAARHQLETNIHFHDADLLDGIAPGSLDFVVSNPPYVGDSEADHVQLEVRKFEPRNAVFAGPTGTEVIARLIPQAHAALRPGGWLIFEISGTIASAVDRLLREAHAVHGQNLLWHDVLITPDLQSIPRIARARKP